MVGKIEVLSEDDYQEKLKSLERRELDRPAAAGKEFLRLNCIVCHTAKGDAQAPVLEEMFGTRRSPRPAAGRQVRRTESPSMRVTSSNPSSTPRARSRAVAARHARPLWREHDAPKSGRPWCSSSST